MKALLVSLTSILLLAYGCGCTQKNVFPAPGGGITSKSCQAKNTDCTIYTYECSDKITNNECAEGAAFCQHSYSLEGASCMINADSGNCNGVGQCCVGEVCEDGSSGSGSGTGVDVACDEALEDPGYGGYPFTSLSYTVPKIEGCPESSAVGKTFSFSCTLCPGGLQGIKGVYKFYEAENVDSPNPNEWKETIDFKGNSFTNTIEGVDTDGKKKKVTATGYFFCPNPDEFSGIKYKDFWNVIMVYLTVDSKDGDPFGINVGATDLAFLGSSTSATFNDILIGLNLCWDENGSWQSENQYCKVGSELFGRECKNPFE